MTDTALGQHAADWIAEHLTTADGTLVELTPWQEQVVELLRSGAYPARLIVRPPHVQGRAFLRDLMIAEVQATPGAVVACIDADHAAQLKERYGLVDAQVMTRPTQPLLGSREGGRS